MRELSLAGRDKLFGIRAPGLAVSVDLEYVFSVWVTDRPCDGVVHIVDMS